ncbi:major vault protein-like [Amphiura filiformis]|uniref:major vault protein-like n=1 Tax=Amphiura filiformis TaxID=82378 RepID=UPI003B224427
MSGLVNIGPNEFVFVLDVSSNVTRLEVGPKRLTLMNNEHVTAGPLPCIIVPPGHYCVIKNPMKKYTPGEPCEVNHGYQQVRFNQEPFPLYPGEILQGAENFYSLASLITGGYGGVRSDLRKKTPKDYASAIRPLPVVKPNQAIRLKAILDFEDGDVKRQTGDLWQIEGPCTYMPIAEVEIVGMVDPVIIQKNEAVRLQALQEFTDKDGVKRVAEEEWLVREAGAYLPGVYEQVLTIESAYILTQWEGLHLEAKYACVDAQGKKRTAGEQWLVTGDDVEAYIQEIGETVLRSVKKTVLPKGCYCVVKDPVDKKGKCQLGKEELRVGISSFFLHPGESIPAGIQQQYVLAEDEAVVVEALDKFTDDSIPGTYKPDREPGDRWMIQGPVSYIPPIQVQVIDQGNGVFVRKAIALGINEGIYVRDMQSGEIRAEMGPQSYLLNENEQLWKKELPPDVEAILKNGGGIGKGDIRKLAYFESSIDPEYSGTKPRDKTRVVRYRCPHNTAVQVYKYAEKTARVVFGPDMVILGPHEDFNILSLSAGKPKVERALQTICLMLGPDYITDILEVETSDHARLKIRMAFNNHFEVEPGDKAGEEAIFSVPDFIGHACREVGSRIRGAVSRVKFDEFHKHSMELLKVAVFGATDDGKVKDRLKFSNQLVITNVDVQGIEPVDLTMKDSLLKSVQMAIEIATNSVERAAVHDAKRKEQQAFGLLERQKLVNEKENEKARTKLFELQAEAAAVESSGQAKAEAQATAERLLIEGQSAIENARLKAQAEEIMHTSELEIQSDMRHNELAYVKESNHLEISRAQQLSDIEGTKFNEIVKTLGTDTLNAIAVSGPKMQVELLESLGIETTIIMDGNNPFNLIQTAGGLVGDISAYAK